MPDMCNSSDERIDGRYLIAQFMGGTLTGWLVLGGLLYLDLSGLWTLLSRSDMWLAAIVMLGTAFGMTFGIATMATGFCWRGTGRAPVYRHRGPRPIASVAFARARGRSRP